MSDRENDRNDEQINTKIIDVVKAGALPVKAKQKTGKMCPMWKRQEKGTMRPNVLTNEQNTTHEKKTTSTADEYTTGKTSKLHNVKNT